ncbi:tripartite tricarboxylate transporter substrate binding protein [Acidovorax sp. Be4]|uniref:Tripartite tricarboxylate transporter substrate binding protein n=1 Tax=Acidovorax bellezanensis TaxID=2976702 RepID=A0ABT2PFQ6_9BURK|nr:tripartite tricarboxylate transporter substrate binding protein [Acidovorax sp. Be4]MCT9809201.1 tripartite tricarboxylate transporter substrate binding protein [Acidovorax sp. Be4]
MKRFQQAIAAVMGVTALCMAATAAAQDGFPKKPIRILVPYPAGGVVDSIARIVGDKLAHQYGQPVIVENKPGAGGAIGTEYVAKSAADGYTLLMVSPSYAVAPLLQKSITWDPVRDFKGIAGFGVIPNVIVVHPGFAAKSMAELVDIAKKGAAPPTYASSGLGTSSHLTGELLAQSARIPLTHVPYKGQPEAISDLLAGRVDMMPMSTSLALPHINAGKLRPLAVTTGARSTALPLTPTVAEAARLPGFEVGTWLALVAPRRTPEPVLQKLSTDVAQALALPDVKKKFQTLALEGAPQTGPEFDRFLSQEVVRWSAVVKQAGIQPNQGN